MQDIRDFAATATSFETLETFVTSFPYCLRSKTNPEQTLLILFPTSETPDFIAEETNGVVFAAAKEKVVEICTPSEYAFDISNNDFDALFHLSTDYNDDTGEISIGNNDPEVTGRIRILSGDDTVKIRESVDGTLINLFYNPFEAKWCTSTSRMYDARQSFWTSPKPFDTLFREALGCKLSDPFYGLNETVLSNSKYFTHSFILCHPESRQIVPCAGGKPYLTYISSQLTGHTGSIPETDASYPALNTLRESLRTRTSATAAPIRFQSSPSIESVLDHLTMHPDSTEMFTLPLLHRGIVVDVVGKRKYKLDYPQFKLVEKIRGENKNILVEYTDALLKQYNPDLELQTQAADKLALLRIHFSDYAALFSHVDHQFYETCKTIQNLYFQVHVRHYYHTMHYIPEKYEQTLRQLHALYKRTGNKTTVYTVASHLSRKINGYIMYTQLMATAV